METGYLNTGYRTLNDVISTTTKEHIPACSTMVENAENNVRKNREELARTMDMQSRLSIMLNRKQEENNNWVQVYTTPSKSLTSAVGSKFKQIFGKSSRVSDAAYEENISTRITKDGELLKEAYGLLGRNEPLPEHMSTREIETDLINRLKLKESSLHSELYELNKTQAELRSNFNYMIEFVFSVLRTVGRLMRNISSAAA